MVKLDRFNRLTKICSLIGFCISTYALYVEISLEKYPKFKPYCNVMKHINCSPAFTSRFAKGFGVFGYLLGNDSIINVPNGLVGMFYYIIFFLLGFSNNQSYVNMQYYLAILSNIMNFYLAYILIIIIKELCLVCVTTYLVNILSFLIVSIKRKTLIENTIKSKIE
ncbi:vitamin K epoxide reductase complex subunit 1-like protein 1 [Daktulosphaira vitifoliae]|uniref:vitamin K epoxide reductase complex subunit 1-like protein 1 n=1 Tax=Daktulosphaira vitifoliae TaxID=58002 RepID=UPI0021A9B7B0|nr:vitamin K epoxide reductase complex subunit 1-like protein 1 [Daktulosphaira vitifoliae]